MFRFHERNVEASARGVKTKEKFSSLCDKSSSGLATRCNIARNITRKAKLQRVSYSNFYVTLSVLFFLYWCFVVQ